jgi:hypothetical protein
MRGIFGIHPGWGVTLVRLSREGASRSEGIWATRTMLSTKRAVAAAPGAVGV